MGGQQRVQQTFLTLFCAYLCLNTITRWLRWPLFHGHGEYGWAQPDALEYVWLMGICLLPIVAASIVLYLLVRRMIHSRAGLLWLALSLWLLLLVLEVDMSWYHVSKRHLGWSELNVIAFTPAATIGLSSAGLYRFTGLAVVHGVVIALIYVIGTRWPIARTHADRVLRALALGALLAFVAVPVLLGRASVRGDQQMEAIAAAHPLRIALLGQIYRAMSGYSGQLRELNALYASLPAARPVPRGNALGAALPPLADTDRDVIVLVLEGLNEHYFSDLSALRVLDAHAVQGARHYSTGDCTHYGLLGLSHGEPMLFYGGARRPQSQPIQILDDAGFVTRRFGMDVSTFGNIEQYSSNFSAPTVAPSSNWALLPALRDYLIPDGQPKMALVYYEGTHFPYLHDARFSDFQPEVPVGFDYSGWDMQSQRRAIINRYRNSLAELNAWLERFLAQTDLSRSIVVITGDHGEEMFEQGRMTHAGGLWEGQLRVPLLIHVPDGVPAEVQEVTSHADILPALLHALRLPLPAPPVSAVADGYAIAAHNNFVATPLEWVFIHADNKILFTLDAANHFVITGVTTRDDVPLSEFDASAGSALRASLARMKSAESAGRALLQSR